MHVSQEYVAAEEFAIAFESGEEEHQHIDGQAEVAAEEYGSDEEHQVVAIEEVKEVALISQDDFQRWKMHSRQNSIISQLR